MADGPSIQSARRQSGDGAAGGTAPSRARASSDSAAARSPGSRNAGEPTRSAAELGGLRLHVAQPLDVALEVVQLPHDVGHGILFQQLLQPGGPVALALPSA